jgi:hypothetical protein
MGTFFCFFYCLVLASPLLWWLKLDCSSSHCSSKDLAESTTGPSRISLAGTFLRKKSCIFFHSSLINVQMSQPVEILEVINALSTRYNWSRSEFMTVCSISLLLPHTGQYSFHQERLECFPLPDTCTNDDAQPPCWRGQ